MGILKDKHGYIILNILKENSKTKNIFNKTFLSHLRPHICSGTLKLSHLHPPICSGTLNYLFSSLTN